VDLKLRNLMAGSWLREVQLTLGLTPTIATYLFAFIVWLQYLVVVLALLKSEAMFAFYQSLTASRDKAKGGITDSYRHLREHGNSFFIVLLEILLGFVLISVGTFGPTASVNLRIIEDTLLLYISIIMIWIVPAALVWLVGTLLERRFSGADAEPRVAGDASQATRP
jgi:hypothetical protein